MLSLLYLLVRTLVRLVVGAGQHGRDEHAKDLEILVLRLKGSVSSIRGRRHR
jgi:hypothetical protein